MAPEQTPFVDLPAALVEEVLGQAQAAGDLLLHEFQEIKEGRATLRRDLENSALLLHESALGCPPVGTTCATDGSYAIERLLTADLAAAAAVAVEGLTPPSEKRHWEQPHHSTYVMTEMHYAETATVLRAVMLGRELLLAVKAPHDMIMVDGTLTLPIIYFNQALNQSRDAATLNCSQEFRANCADYLAAYRTILWSERTDRNYIALPKYSTRREIGRKLKWPHHQDDRGLLTLLLRAGELTVPLPLEQPTRPWHLSISGLEKDAVACADAITQGLYQAYVLYYKPHGWLPALRVEVGESIAKNNHRLAAVVQGLKHQCSTPSMLEPYPIYLADRTVKALARSLPAFRQVATQRVSEKYEGDVGEVFFAMHGYRSEAGGKGHG